LIAKSRPVKYGYVIMRNLYGNEAISDWETGGMEGMKVIRKL
jgi:hypothetical protein